MIVDFSKAITCIEFVASGNYDKSYQTTGCETK